MKESTKASVYVLLACLLWGTTGTAQAFAPKEANPLVIGALRMTIGGTILFVSALLREGKFNLTTISKRDVLLASISIAMYQPLFFSGVSRTGVALGTVLAIGSAPIFSGIIETIRGQRPTLQWTIATSISILGCILLFSGEGQITLDIYGGLLSLGAGLSYALYVTASQKLLQQAPRAHVNGLVFFISALILAPILFFYDLTWVASASGLLSVLHLGVFTLAAAYTLFAYGLINISASRAVTLTLAEPLTAAVLGMLVLREKLTAMALMGIALIFIGLMLSVRGKQQE